MQIRLPKTHTHPYSLSWQTGDFLTFISMLFQERCWCLPFARRETHRVARQPHVLFLLFIVRACTAAAPAGRFCKRRAPTPSSH